MSEHTEKTFTITLKGTENVPKGEKIGKFKIETENAEDKEYNILFHPSGFNDGKWYVKGWKTPHKFEWWQITQITDTAERIFNAHVNN